MSDLDRLTVGELHSVLELWRARRDRAAERVDAIARELAARVDLEQLSEGELGALVEHHRRRGDAGRCAELEAELARRAL